MKALMFSEGSLMFFLPPELEIDTIDPNNPSLEVIADELNMIFGSFLEGHCELSRLTSSDIFFTLLEGIQVFRGDNWNFAMEVVEFRPGLFNPEEEVSVWN